jgi:hypothetical protein
VMSSLEHRCGVILSLRTRPVYLAPHLPYG